MVDEYDKCRFCTSWDNYDGNWDCWCNNKDGFKMDKQRLIEKAQETGLSVADIIALVELG